MPIATANVVDTERKELKSLAGAFVVLRRMTYGQIVDRRALMKLSVSGNQKDKNSIQGEMAMANRQITAFEYRHCVVDHNLEKEVNGATVKLNLGDAEDMNLLDPRVGQEIEQYINDMNNFEDEDQEN